MTEMMGDMMRGAAVDALESVMDSGAMQVLGSHQIPSEPVVQNKSWT